MSSIITIITTTIIIIIIIFIYVGFIAWHLGRKFFSIAARQTVRLLQKLLRRTRCDGYNLPDPTLLCIPSTETLPPLSPLCHAQCCKFDG